MSVAALRVDAVSHWFGGLQALRDVSVTIGAGERRALIGPNGAGKTTLFNMIAGQARPKRGRIHLFGEDVTEWGANARARAGLARTFQITNLFPKLLVRDNILLATLAESRARFTFWLPRSLQRRALSRTAEVLEAWRITHLADVAASQLPYGEQRRLEIILALTARHDVLLLDEPTAGLAGPDVAMVCDIIDALPRDIALLLIEHDMDVAFRLADTVTVLNEGKVLAEGTVAEVRRNEDVHAVYLGAGSGSAP